MIKLILILTTSKAMGITGYFYLTNEDDEYQGPARLDINGIRDDLEICFKKISIRFRARNVDNMSYIELEDPSSYQESLRIHNLSMLDLLRQLVSCLAPSGVELRRYDKL